MTTDNKQHAAVPVQVLLGCKLGMTQVWDADGRPVPLTVMQVGINVVTQVRTEGVDEYSAVQLEFDKIPAYKVTKPIVGRLAKAGAELHRHLTEVHTSTVDNYELSQELQATVFETDQAVDASDNIKGKGFAGIMERHGFAGAPVSHGAHRNHRKPGSIGICATPGHTFKGLHVAGCMGSVRRTIQNLKIQTMGAEKGLLFISSAIPGPKNGVALVRFSVKGA